MLSSYVNLIPGRLLSNDSKSIRYVVKIFNAVITSSKENYEQLCQQLICLQEKCKNDFKVPYPVQTLQKSDENNSTEYIALYQLPLLDSVTFDGCNKEELLEKKLLVMSESGEKFLVHHLIRLTIFIEGKVPDEKKYLDEKLAYNWGKCNGLLQKHFEV